MSCVDWAGLCGVVWTLRYSVFFMEESELCGIVWAISKRVKAGWKRFGCVEVCWLCGIVWAVWNRVRCVE